jgi:hypothetical protein
VVMDLARFTDNLNGDVIVTNQGISDRRGIGLPAVKACLRLLQQLGVLRKTEPSPDRRAELRQAPGGFSNKRRYLVWNPQSKWRVPDTPEGVMMAIEVWSGYVGKSTAAQRADRHSGVPRC